MSVNTPITNARTLQESCLGISLSFRWLGLKRAVKGSSLDEVADNFHADRKAVSLSKTLIDTRNEHYKRLTKAKGAIGRLWKDGTLPWVEDGVRLVRKDGLDRWEREFTEAREGLETAAGAFADRYESIVREGMDKLGTLADRADYPTSGEGLFGVDRKFVNLNPPDYLKTVDPALYQEQADRVARQFQESLKLAEQAFAREFQDMLAGLADRLKPGEDGKPKVFKASSLEKIKDFIARFKTLHVTSSHELDALVDQATVLVGGVDVGDLRSDASLRAQVAAGVAQIGQALEANVYVPPRRKITRGGKGAKPPAVEPQAGETPQANTPAEESAPPQTAVAEGAVAA